METICSLLVFAKAPHSGKVKTRLIPTLGPEGAAELYEHMLLHALGEASAADIGPIELWCAPDTQDEFFADCAQQFRLSLHTQQGADLGERMAHALRDALTRARCVILIGSDCPALDAAYLRQAAAALQKNNVVIAPADDGGYALIGVSQAVPDIFDAIDWSTARVMAQTRQKLLAQKITFAELPPLWDVDTAEDLRRLAAWPGLASALSTIKAG
ncbi:MAG: TIGR04282 family arsenosugar biosynthesis glycosyltransferase [Burkholderiales bacterium]